MPEIFHELPIQASVNKVYQAVTESALISQWWLPNSKLDSRIGGRGTFPLSDGQNKIEMEVIELVPDERTVWKCLGHKFVDWANTTVTFEILPEGDHSMLRFSHSGWADRSGVFGKTSFYWASIYLRKLKQLAESGSLYDWSKFDIHLFLMSSPEKVFEKFSTCSGLESFFVKAAQATSQTHNTRERGETFQEGDQYQWDWFFDYRSTGQIQAIVPNQSVSFTFGKCNVFVELNRHDTGTLLHLCQTGMDLNEKDMVTRHLDCRGGWIYFLTNLKAVLEHGVDVRDKRVDTSQSLEVGWALSSH